MVATAKDLRFNISMLFDLLNKGEDITITYRGKVKAKLVSYNDSLNITKSDEIFGMLKDDTKDVDSIVRDMRQGRSFAI
jgi:antitoxin (DNA-binding transcriptional repressor) of toxin-antitoxin stability system